MVRKDELRNGRTCRNVVIDGRRTSLRLEDEYWDAIGEICEKHGICVSDFCDMVLEEIALEDASNFSSALRVTVLAYFRRGTVLLKRLAGEEPDTLAAVTNAPRVSQAWAHDAPV